MLRILLCIVLVVCAGCAPSVPAPAGLQPPTHMPATATPDNRTITLAAVGDIMLGRYVGRRIAALGASYPFTATHQLLASDILLGNLESPLTNRRTPGALRPGPYRLPADPAAVAGLQDAGFTALSLANNHALDAGPAGLEEAAEVVKRAGITPLGVGTVRMEAQKPHTVAVNGLRVALLAANDVPDPADQPDEAQGWGRAPLDDAFLDAVRTARKEADLVVVLVHWGAEYASQPGLRQRQQADALVDAGADVVIGAHPHVLQPIAVMERAGRRALVAYSLGNFVFDQPFSQETSRSAVLHLSLDHNGVIDYRASPVAIVDGQPRPLSPDDPTYAAVMRDLGLNGTNAPSTVPTQLAALTDSGDAVYSWNGTTFAPVPIASSPSQAHAATTPLTATADIRGDGTLSLLTVDANGLAELHESSTPNSPVVWRNEADTWRVTQAVAGDADNDGRYEFLLILWKPDDAGVLRCHPFMLGWRGGRYRIFWGGSAVNESIQAAALGDVNNDGHTDLVVLEGGTAPGEATTSVAVWQWHGWGFERLWRSAVQGATTITLQDMNNDGTPEIVLQKTS